MDTNDAMMYLETYRTWENFGGGKFWRIWRTVGNSPKFSPPIFINARVFNKLPTNSPNFSSPKTSEPLIRQNFPPPKFSYIRYLTLVLTVINMLSDYCLCYNHSFDKNNVRNTSCHQLATSCM